MQRLGRLERAHSAEQQNLRIRIPQMRDSIEAMRTVRTLSTAPSAHFTIGKESTPSPPGGREIWGPLPPGEIFFTRRGVYPFSPSPGYSAFLTPLADPSTVRQEVCLPVQTIPRPVRKGVPDCEVDLAGSNPEG